MPTQGLLASCHSGRESWVPPPDSATVLLCLSWAPGLLVLRWSVVISGHAVGPVCSFSVYPPAPHLLLPLGVFIIIISIYLPASPLWLLRFWVIWLSFLFWKVLVLAKSHQRENSCICFPNPNNYALSPWLIYLNVITSSPAPIVKICLMENELQVETRMLTVVLQGQSYSHNTVDKCFFDDYEESLVHSLINFINLELKGGGDLRKGIKRRRPCQTSCT